MTIACKKCGAGFETGPEVGQHARDAHSKPAEAGSNVPYRCCGCDSLFSTARELLAHGSHPVDKQAEYDRTIQSLLRCGYVAKVDAKGITGYHAA